MNTTLICISLLGFLVFALALNVSLSRGKTQTLYGGKEDPENWLYKAQRAHINAVEYVPILGVLMLALNNSVQAEWVTWMMIMITFSRYLHAAGILIPATMAKPNPMRALGALGTFIGGFSLAFALFFQIV